jgi:hypothetical protein
MKKPKNNVIKRIS